MNLDKLRREYLHGALMHADLADDPIEQFQRWLQQAIELQIHDPTAMVLATVDAEGQPSQRIVLLKHVDAEGFVFYTNYNSRKAQDLLVNAKVSLLFPWNSIDRQVKVWGQAQKVSQAQSRSYFASRPRESQLAAWASPQSEQIASRQALLDDLEKVKQRFADQEIPLPEFWGGFRIRPRQVEFWQGGEHRLHDRFEYSLQSDDRWQIRRLAP